MRHPVAAIQLLSTIICLALGQRVTAADWKLNNTTTSDNWTDVVYAEGNGFVAVGSNGKITTSSDGIHFIERNPGVKLAYRGIAHGNGVFAALGRDIGKQKDMVLTSPDGITWTDATDTFKPPAYANRILFANDKFIIPNVTSIKGLAYGAGIYVAVVPDNRKTTVYSSADGNTFSIVGDIDDEAQALVFDGVKFVMVGVHRDENYQPFPVTWTSTDGVTWGAATLIPEAKGNLTDVIFADGVFYAAGNGLSAPANIFSSIDGTTWGRELTSEPQNYDLGAIAEGAPSGLVAVGSGVVVTTYEVPEYASLWRYNIKQQEYTTGLKETGIGWIYDIHYPFVYSFTTNTWIWVYPESTLSSIFAFAFTDTNPHWIWTTNDYGWYYNFAPADPEGYLSW